MGLGRLPRHEAFTGWPPIPVQMADTPDAITLSEDGFSMPTIEVLTGRGFVTGKSGSGKSNTASVVAEELLAAGAPMLVVDADGEYYGLKESFELLHVGGDDRCDLQVSTAHAERLASVALDRQVPVVLDLSGYRDPDEGREVVGAVVGALFARAADARTPFLLLVEEAHEFIPEGGGLDDVGKTLVRVAKRGRKRGLGVCALSQRPASVSKEYITQCDWLVWHRLTWDNDTAVVSRILGSEAADEVGDLADGEAIVMTDWDGQTTRVRFRRKRTFDAGATPDLGGVETPDLKSVDDDLLADLAGVDADESEGGADDDTETDNDSPTANASGATESGTASASGAASAAASGAGGGARGGGGGGDPANDPAWEVARFVTYLTGSLLAGLARTGRAAGRLGGRALRWTADGLTRTPESQRRVEWLLPKLLLLLVGFTAGVAVVSLL